LMFISNYGINISSSTVNKNPRGGKARNYEVAASLVLLKFVVRKNHFENFFNFLFSSFGR
jgi:hypothetical protein